MACPRYYFSLYARLSGSWGWRPLAVYSIVTFASGFASLCTLSKQDCTFYKHWTYKHMYAMTSCVHCTSTSTENGHFKCRHVSFSTLNFINLPHSASLDFCIFDVAQLKNLLVKVHKEIVCESARSHNIECYVVYEALQDIVYIRLPPGMNFGISLKRSEITQMGYFWSPLDS